jgi:lysophospholipase L1-like esterase
MQQASEILQRNLTELVERFKEAGLKILLLQYPQPSSDFADKIWRHLDAGNPAIAEVASRENVPTLNLAPAFLEAAKTHPLAELHNPDDGVHLNPYGEIVLARTLFFRLRELGWVPVSSLDSVPA